MLYHNGISFNVVSMDTFNYTEENKDGTYTLHISYNLDVDDFFKEMHRQLNEIASNYKK